MGQQLCGANDNATGNEKLENSVIEEEINAHCESILLMNEEQEIQDHKVGVKDFKIIKVIGRGSFGKVMLVKKIDTGQIFAMKTLRKKNLQKRKFILQTKAEKCILSSLSSPFIVRLFYAFQTKQKLYLVMEFVNGGELYFHLKRAKRFSEELIRFYASELVVALKYIHNLKIIYRDLKPENILLDYTGHIKLTDFGLAKQLQSDKTYTFCGTPEYMAPELLKGEGYSHAADWWTLGAILFEMITGKPPFYSQERKKIFQNILENELKIPSGVAPNVAQLLRRLLNKNVYNQSKYQQPKNRLGSNGAQDVQNEPFFQDVDWDQVEKRQVKPPWVPKLSGPHDLSYIDPAFTGEIPKDTPMTKITLPNESAFQDFSYMAVDEDK